MPVITLKVQKCVFGTADIILFPQQRKFVSHLSAALKVANGAVSGCVIDEILNNRDVFFYI